MVRARPFSKRENCKDIPRCKIRRVKNINRKRVSLIADKKSKNIPASAMQKSIENDTLKVYGWLYNIKTGEVEYLESKDGEFKPLDEYKE